MTAQYLLGANDWRSGDDESMVPASPSWFDAWVSSSYGAGGFWRIHHPDRHFRTAATLGPEMAQAVLAVLAQHPQLSEVVDIGAGDGELLAALHAESERRQRLPGCAARARPLRLTGVDLRPRPAALPSAVDWVQDCWDVRTATWADGPAARMLAALAAPTLLVCTEWLDDLPCRAAVGGPGGWHELLPTGEAGAALDEESTAWARKWWPAAAVEVGSTRDTAWAALLAALSGSGGLALMVDYGHRRDDRPTTGSLTAYRSGRRVAVVPDATRNVTAHVAVDAVAAAGHRAGARTLVMARQREVLPVLLGHPVPGREVVDQAGDLAGPDPADPLAALTARSRRAALSSAGGWGEHWWLLQEVPARPAVTA